MDSNTGMSAADVLALTRGNDNGLFGGTAGTMGIFALIIIFILLFGGNGGLWGNNNSTQTALGMADLQNSLYFQSQDATLRGLA